MPRMRRLLSWSKNFSFLPRYGVVTALVVATAAANWLLNPYLASFPFFLFVAMVAFVSLTFDRASGIYAGILSALLIVLFFQAPRGSLTMAGNAGAIFIFLFVAFALSMVNEGFHILASQLDDAEREKSLLLREFHHRSRNNMQIFNALLAVQTTSTSNPEVREALQAVSRRLIGLSRLQDHLLRPDGPEVVQAPVFVESLCLELETTFAAESPVAIECVADPIPLDRDFAGAIGITVNELVFNALKHAYAPGQPGRVRIELRQEERDSIRLAVTDDGAGCRPDPQQGMGLKLVSSLLSRYSGTLSLEDARPGCRAVVTFPVQR